MMEERPDRRGFCGGGPAQRATDLGICAAVCPRHGIVMVKEE